jgi:2-hydroxy-6-oxonona-2,4-dienedioate hydrolase
MTRDSPIGADVSSRRVVLADGTGIHYRVAGNPAEPAHRRIILVHGLVASSRYMVPLARELGRSFLVYAPDLPGFGKSDKPRKVLSIADLAVAVADWMQAMELGPTHLIGNSMGCNILAEFALMYPELTDHLVMQGPTTDPTARSTIRQVTRWMLNGWREPSMGNILIKDYAAAGVRRAIVTTGHLMRHRIEDRLSEVRAPTLVLRGCRDPIVPHAWAERATALLPHGCLVEVPDVGHTMNIFAPAQFAEAVRHFLPDSIPSRGSQRAQPPAP